MADIAIIGIGNPFRSDDGIGWAVIEALEGRVSSRVALHQARSDIAELMEYFSRYQTVYLVDACQGEGLIGSFKRIESLDELEQESFVSTHGFGLAQAIALAKNCRELPDRLVIYAIYVDRFQLGSELSVEAKSAVEEVVQRLLQEEGV